MADMIARLKIDSSEYDSKVKRAAEGILHLERTIREAGESFIQTWKDEQEFAKGLGQMETVSKTARGKISELTSAFTEMSLVYKRMTDEEKNSPFGQGLKGSLDQLKVRITDDKKELSDIDKELKQTDTDGKNLGGVLDQLAGKFGISTKSLMGWGAAIGAGTTALKVAKDAFFASDQNIDDWARTTTIAKSSYEGFLTALNTGDISGYLNNISQITQAAAEAYNAIDRLQTMQNIQSPKVSAKQAEIQRFEVMLRTGRYIAPVDGRKGAMAEGTVLNDVQKKQIADNLSSAMREIAILTKNEVKASTDAINALYKEQALRLGMNNEEFRKGTASMAAFEANLEKARKYQEFEAQHTTRTQMNTSAGVVTQNVRDNVANPYEAYKNWAVFKDDGDLYQRIIQLIQQRSGAESQYYGQMGRAYRGINKVDGDGGGSGKTAKTYDEGIKLGKGMDGLAGVTIATYESMDDLNRQLSEYKKALNAATNVVDEMAARKGIADVEWKMSDVGRQAAKLGWSKEDLEAESKKMQEALGNIEPLKIEAHIETDASGFAKDAEEMAKEWNAAGTAIKAVGAAMASIDDPAAKVMGTIAQAVATMALSYAQAAASPAVAGTGWGWIAFAATGVATMLSSIEAIKNATHFAQGGIVGGSDYTDNTPIMVSSGELILNKAQQNILAAELTRSSDGSGVSGTPYVSGEQIFLGLNNYLRRTGRGELVTAH